MKILGLNIFHADTSACLIVDGKIIAASEEERFARVKHYSGFPVNSIHHALKEGNLDINDIDIISINSNPYYNFFHKIKYLFNTFGNIINLPKRILRVRSKIELDKNLYNYFGTTKKFKKVYVPHHNAHIYSSFLCSGLDHGLGLSFDASGDFSTTEVYKIHKNKFKTIKKQIFPHSLGIFYQAITQFLGFNEYGDEYKVMGLAGFGNNTFKDQFDKIINFDSNNLFKLNLKYFRHHIIGFDFNFQNNIPFFENLYSDNIKEILGKPRKKNEEIKQEHYDIAYSLQKKFEEISSKIISHYKEDEDKNLFLSGGCAFNAVNNKSLSEKHKFDNIIIQPNSGDAGGALGSALYASKKYDKKFINQNISSIYMGPKETDEEIYEKIKKYIDKEFVVTNFKKEEEESLLSLISNNLYDGKIVAWHQDRMEFGPRALGNRSILANPLISSIKDEINKKIKTRETFRPFAPSVMRDEVNTYFNINTSMNYNYMNVTCETKKEYIDKIQSVLNADGTARIQIVDIKLNRKYYKLIKQFKKLSGYGLLLNTSLNIQEPICCNSEDTIKSFLKSDIDVLCIENYVIQRNYEN